MSNGDDHKRLQEELTREGEAEASREEIASARRLAERLEGGLHVLDPSAGEAEALVDFAESVRKLDDPVRAGAAVARAVSAAFAGEAGPGDAATTDETLVSGELAREVDRMLAGAAPGEASEDVSDLARLAAMIRAHIHPPALSQARVEQIAQAALAGDAPLPAAASAPELAVRRGPLRLLAGGLLAACLALLVVGVLFLQRPVPRGDGGVPAHYTSRSSRNVLPGPFPRTQTETERIDIIFHDRLRSYREVSLGGLGRQGRRAKRGGR